MLPADPRQALLALAGQLGPGVGDLALDFTTQSVGLQLRRLAQRRGVVLGLQPQRLALAARGLEQGRRLRLSPGDLGRDLVLEADPELADLAQPPGAQLAAVPLGLLAQLGGVATGLLADPLALQRRRCAEVVRLLLRQPEDLVRAPAQAGVVDLVGVGLAQLALLQVVLQAGDLASSSAACARDCTTLASSVRT